MSLTLCIAGSAESADLGPAGRAAASAEWVEDELPALADGPLVRRLAGGGFGRAGGHELAALLADAQALATAVADAALEAIVAYRGGRRVHDEEGELVYWPAERAGSWLPPRPAASASACTAGEVSLCGGRAGPPAA